MRRKRKVKKIYSYKKYDLKKTIKNRTYIVTIVFTAIYLGLICRLYYIQNYKDNTYAVMADKQYYYEEKISNINYKLLGRNNEELFNYENKYYIVVDPMTFINMNNNTDDNSIKTVMYILRNYDKEYDLYQIPYMDKNKKYTYEVDKETYEKIKNYTDVNGVYGYISKDALIEKNWKLENIIASPKNYDDEEFKDKDSLEVKVYNMIKNNKFPKVVYEKNVDGKIISEKFIESNENINVKLTINKNAETLIENILKDNLLKKYPQVGVCLVESSTGEVLSMCQKNDNISNVNIGVPSSNGFLVGSVFKTIVLEGVLDRESHSLKENLDIKHIFPKSNEHKSRYNLSEAYLYSSNDIFAQLGWDLGSDTMISYAEKQGLTSKVLGLSDEKCGTFDNIDDKENIGFITNTSIGQTLRTTPIALTSIPSVVVNDGIYIKPNIIKGYVDNANNVIQNDEVEKKQVINEKTANLLEKEMIKVIKSTDGTGRNADVKGINMGGKTGTTEYFIKGKEYSDGWFAGFFQYKNKYYSLVVFIPEIDIKEDAGGRTSALVFKKIVEELTSKEIL